MRRGTFVSRFTDAERITPDTYVNGLGECFLAAHLPSTRCLDDFYKRVEVMLSDYHDLRKSGTPDGDRVVALFVRMPTVGISVSHRTVVACMSSIFGFEYSEVRLTTSRNAKVFDLRGRRLDILAFLPVFKYVLAVYDRLSREYVTSLRCSTAEKRVRRKEWTAVFCEHLLVLWRDVSSINV